jgi:hypothetical protein
MEVKKMDATQLDIYSETMGDNTYLKLEDARNDRLLNKWLTINDVEQKTMKQTDFKTGEEKEVDKLVLGFEEIKYVLPLNKTNGRVMINDYGPQTDKWLDIKIKLKVNHYPKFEGIGIKSLQDLEDEGETPPAKAVTDDKEQIKQAMKDSNAVRNAVDTLNDMNLDVTLSAIRKEVETMMAQNEITKKQHIQALEALGE